ncbi:hypothetical protein D3C75_998340 [compost metagenome]
MSQLNNLIDRNLALATTIKFGDIINSIEYERDALDLIKAIDLAQVDGDFTIALIKELFKSLRGDFDQEEGKELIKELKKLNKSIA